MTSEFLRREEEAGQQRAADTPDRTADTDLARLRADVEALARLSPEELLVRLDVLRAGADFEKLMNCNKDKDCHLYSDVMLRADKVADGYIALNSSFSDGGSSSKYFSASAREPEDGLQVFEIWGAIKWFDVAKGFGFIVPDNGLMDILLHVTCLRAGGYQTAYEGARVHCQVLARPKGMQAFRILHMDESSAIHSSLLPQRTHVHVEPESDWERAMVKWFNRVRGFGFLTRGDGTADIFVHMESLRRFGFTELLPGQFVQVRWGMGSKGCMVAELKPDGAIGCGTPPA